jgi:protein O-mannosyl-transferase
MTEDRRNFIWKVAAPAVVVLSAALYFGALFGSFVWDDYSLVNGEAIGGGKSFLACFTKPFMHNFFRPLVSVSFFLERRLWHNVPLGYHVTNLLLHTATTGVLILLLREAFRSRGVALVGGLLFAIQPVQVGAVAWIGGRTDSMCALWVVLFAWMLVRAARATADARGLHLAAGVVAYTLAIFTKEQALGLLLLVPFAFWCWHPEKGRNPCRTAWLAAVPFALSALLFVVMGYFLGMPRPGIAERSLGEAFTQVGMIATYYALVLLAPTPQSIFTFSLGELERAGSWPVFTGYVILLAVGATLWRLRRTSPPALWFLALVVLSLAPVSGVIPLPFLLVAPYRAGVAGIGLAAVAGWWVTVRILPPVQEATLRRPPSRALGYVTGVALGVVLLWHAALTAWGMVHWQSEITFYETVVRYDPNSIVTRSNLAFRYCQAGRDEEAVGHYEHILNVLFRSKAWRAEASALEAVRRDRRILARAVQNQGTRDDPHYFLGILFARLATARTRAGDFAGARIACLTGEALRPGHPEVNVARGYLAAAQGDDAEAILRYQMALAVDTRSTDAHRLLGFAFARQDQWLEARDEFAAWLKAEPDSTEAKEALAKARQQLGDVALR